jgi:hypothetical protein
MQSTGPAQARHARLKLPRNCRQNCHGSAGVTEVEAAAAQTFPSVPVDIPQSWRAPPPPRTARSAHCRHCSYCLLIKSRTPKLHHVYRLTLPRTFWKIRALCPWLSMNKAPAPHQIKLAPHAIKRPLLIRSPASPGAGRQNRAQVTGPPQLASAASRHATGSNV